MNRQRTGNTRYLVFLVAMLLLPACQPQKKDLAQQFPLSSVASVQFMNEETGWMWGAAGHSFTLFRTDDRGVHWRPDLANGDVPLSLGMNYLSSAKLFIQDPYNITINWTNEKGLHVLRSTNQGAQWQEAVIPNPDMARDIEFVDKRLGWILTTGMDSAMGHTQKKVYRTDDGGKTWTIVSSDAGYIPDKNATKDALPQYGSATGMTFSDADHGWVTLENWMDAGVRLFRTADSGHTWEPVKLRIPSGIDPKSSYSIPHKPQFFGPEGRQGMMIVAYKNDTQIRYAKYETMDGGKSWSSFVMMEATDAEMSHQEVFFTSMSKGRAIFKNELWSTQDGGHHWTKRKADYVLQQTLKAYPIIVQLQLTDAESGWLLCRAATADQWVLLNSVDGGIHWTLMQPVLVADNMPLTSTK